jgi:acetylornithine/N-succinyldiaminopimelate aminotransferase
VRRARHPADLRRDPDRLGRTGKLFAHEWAGVEPDIMAVAKAIGGGFPLGACLATERAAAGMTAGTHGSTYGGNPLAMAAANAVLDVMRPRLPAPRQRGGGAAAPAPRRAGGGVSRRDRGTVRGEGLMLGLKCAAPNTEVVVGARDAGLLLVPAGDNVARLLPPLIVSDDEIDEGVRRLETACAAVRAAKAA